MKGCEEIRKKVKEWEDNWIVGTKSEENGRQGKGRREKRTKLKVNQSEQRMWINRR